MENYVLGTYRQPIFQSERGYVIGLMKVKDTDIESMKDYINKTITFTGYFHELNEQESYYFLEKKTIILNMDFNFK